MAALASLKRRAPAPTEVGVLVPTKVDKKLFEEGFSHGMASNELTVFKASFRAGFREAKRYLRELRRQQGVVEFPLRARLSIR
jgi:hypothetical protein